MTSTSPAAGAPAGQGFVFPASFAQRRLWFLHQFDPASPAYNIGSPLRVRAPLDVGALRRSLDEIVRRHEALRTTFAMAEGEPVQVVAAEGRVELEVEDLSALPPAEREAEAERRALASARRPFSLTHGPLLRAGLLRLGPADHVFLLTLHHIVADGWSMGVFFRELGALYGAFSTGRPSPLPELPVQYADFAQWQRDLLEGERFDRLLGYWRRQLAGAPEVLSLPLDRPRPAFRGYHGDVHGATLPPRLYDAVRALARREGATPFMVLLAAFATLLHRYTGETDVSVGSPIANRTRPELEGLIGFFVNTLVLRTDLSGDPTFGELLGRVREATLGAYAHQDMPFEKLVEELRPARSTGHNPLFDVMFVLQSEERAGASPSGGDPASAVAAGTATAKFDLTVSVQEANRTGTVFFEYNTDLFERATIERMAEHFGRILEDAAARPDTPVSALALLDGREREAVLELAAGPAFRAPEGCVHHLFEERARRAPEALAVIDGDERLTYAALDARANRLAHHLRRRGVGPETRVGILDPRSADTVVALLAVLKAGGAYVPLDPRYPDERLRFLAADAGVAVLVTRAALAERLSGTSAAVVLLDGDAAAVAAERGDPPAGAVDPDRLAYVLHTSGSTGLPKGAMLPHRGIASSLAWMQSAHPLEPGDRFLFRTSLNFDPSVWEVFWPLAAGATVVVAPPDAAADPVLLLATIRAHGVSAAYFVPSSLQLLLETPGVEEARSLRLVIAGGESLPAATLRRFFARLDAELVHSYGPTETSIAASEWTCRRDPPDGPLPIGRPLGGYRTHVLDARLHPVPPGVGGELYVGGVGVARGYFRRPGLTAERFVPDPLSAQPGARLYRTGDRARWRSDETLEFLGRVDHQAKIRGYRVEPGEVEAALLRHPAVREAAVAVHDAGGGDLRLAAYVVPEAASSLRHGREGGGEEAAGAFESPGRVAGELRRHLGGTLPEYMVPSHFVLMEALPRFPSGKVNPRALPAPGERGAGADEAAHVPPRDTVERDVAHLFGEVLKRERVGVHDNFFELGGHSLLATRVVARVQEAFGVALPLRRFFEAPTTEGVARAIGDLRASPAAAVTVPLPRLERRPAAEPDVSTLSDGEVDAMLAALLGGG